MSLRTKALIAIIAVSMLWGTAGTAKILLKSFDPFTAAFIRFLIASIVMLPFFLHEQRKCRKALSPLLPVALLSTGNILFFYWGLRTTTASATAVIYAAVPLIVAIAAPKLIGEEITRTKRIGIGIGLIGALFIAVLPALERGSSQISGDFIGNMFVLLAACCWSGYTIASRTMLAAKRTTPVIMTAISFFVSTGIFSVLSAVRWRPEYISAFTPVNVIIFLQLGILVTTFTYLILQWIIKHSSATTASLNQYLQPIFGILFNSVFLGERLTVGFLIGSVIAFSGVVLATGERVFTECTSWKNKRA
jgi:drug/metabolite transporter (DMT)-like permease